MTRTIIPKDCVVCDTCNKQCSDENFIAICDSKWFSGWLYCDECLIKYPNGSGGELIQVIRKGDDLSKTDLALPIVMDFD